MDAGTIKQEQGGKYPTMVGRQNIPWNSYEMEWGKLMKKKPDAVTCRKADLGGKSKTGSQLPKGRCYRGNP